MKIFSCSRCGLVSEEKPQKCLCRNSKFLENNLKEEKD